MDIAVALDKYWDLLSGEITGLLNYVFEYRNSEYVPLEPEWVSENFGIRQLTDTVKAIAEVNRAEWLLPFLGSLMAEKMTAIAREK